ncbi:xylosyltransferase oxt isoform X2 [Daktulosphaira vitifoliae]|uniref:xylosyltransferase oxt isoform X2 n=1 Tax=Daktulosphaira vitifoliae TaxID=58002 RepID=UPI0021A9BC17|nr:xylosyltransferase oxt isoform X2 [Daktulosphaira vitifoliae]
MKLKDMDIKWLRRYRVFCIGGSIILFVQIILAFVFFSTQDYSVIDELSRSSISRFKNVAEYGTDDDDDVSNYNLVPSGRRNQKRLPFDKALGADDLGFMPPCDIIGREPVSALQRAKTQTCKQLIANISCLINSTPPYPQRLIHHCPSNDVSDIKELGCYRENRENKLLQGYKTTNVFTNSQNICKDICLQSGFVYAGVEYGSECFCGNESPDWDLKLPDSLCDMQCPGNLSQKCGGHYTMNIFKTGASRFIAQTASEPLTSLEQNISPVRIVFLLTLNGRAVRQVYRLIKSLYHRDHYFFIHVDSRQDYMFRELSKIELTLSNVRLSRRRHSTIWGGASLLSTLMDSMTDLVQSSWDWDFVINLSESDFPIKSNDALVKFLTANREYNFVKSHGREVQQFIQKQGLDKAFVECETRMWRVGEKELPKGIVWDGGSDWIALSRPFVNYLVTGDELISGLMQFFKYTLLPAESFFHTVLRNSPFCTSYIDNNLHVTNWKRWLGCKCQYRHVVDWCGCSPNVFRIDDWNRIKNTEKKQVFFARKFEPIISLTVIDMLDVWLYGDYPKDMRNRMSYWQNVYHFEDIQPEPDETMLTIGNSLARISVKSLNVANNFRCSIHSLDKLLQIFTYHHQDQFKGFLIQYEVSFSKNSPNILLESWCLPKLQSEVLFNNEPINRLMKLIVSSNYDQKEQMSYDFIHLISPHTEPILIHQWAVGDYSFSVKFIWVNPYGEIANVTSGNIDESTMITFVKPILKGPLEKGIWTVLMIFDNKTVAFTRFLVTPLQLSKNLPMSSSYTSFIKKEQLYDENVQKWGHLIENFNRTYKFETKSRFYDNSRTKLTNWIDSLVIKTYNILETCSVLTSESIDNCGIKMSLCSKTLWSSFSPDPKSDILSINKESGTINRY